ncbi:DNA-3-methyladenine glycosylase family protein [Fervidicella metallireducens]|uniref:DNA-3-methyladenine glycosylase family protein n=1 Tax=Fervidicella metallireducens TaxID=655338 RepID=UPI0005590B6F|nr:DNA glycosylase [Fervidicella metallireducens]
MYKEVVKYEKGIVLKDVRDFELKHIFDCGQCFRWNEEPDGSYIGVASKKAVRISKKHEDIYIHGGKFEDADFWISYLDLNRDYKKIKEVLSKDKILMEAIKHGEGIRILNQEIFETIISFIISANNRIPMIKRAVENISKRFGEEILLDNKIYYTFPSPEELKNATVDDLKNCGCGFRAEYIVETTRQILDGNVNLNEIKTMPTDKAQKELMNLKGIGPKVADCILLFSMGKHDAFPVDVWVKRVMQHFYLAPDVNLAKIREYGRNTFGEYAGFAQQYLFYYVRELKGKLE